MGLSTTFILIIVITAIIIIILSPFTKRLANKWWFWAVIGLIAFAYAFLGRQLQYLVPEFRGQIYVALGRLEPPNQNLPDQISLNYSRLFLLDLCPFYIIFGSLALTFKNKTAAQVMAPFGLFGAGITLFGEIIHDVNNISNLPNGVWFYIFVGSPQGELYFMIHYLSMIVSLMVICWTRNWRKIIFAYMHGFALFYFSWVLIIVSVIPQIIGNSTGVIRGDWIGGEYDAVGKFLNIPDWPRVMIVGYIISYIVINAVILIRIGIQTWSTKWRFLVHNKMLKHRWYVSSAQKYLKHKKQTKKVLSVVKIKIVYFLRPRKQKLI
ncbi:DUF5378 family protein [[Mycoplasma] testudinis]|uniref:DUF5378 family protein n=1 Tax=[Mycoplasma] testudinis TaxID=33924 RepID=UPI000696E617|nr:DUF5378 family protein [[Mycoplasma] testudinis]